VTPMACRGAAEQASGAWGAGRAQAANAFLPGLGRDPWGGTGSGVGPTGDTGRAELPGIHEGSCHGGGPGGVVGRIVGTGTAPGAGTSGTGGGSSGGIGTERLPGGGIGASPGPATTGLGGIGAAGAKALDGQVARLDSLTRRLDVGSGGTGSGSGSGAVAPSASPGSGSVSGAGGLPGAGTNPATLSEAATAPSGGAGSGGLVGSLGLTERVRSGLGSAWSNGASGSASGGGGGETSAAGGYGFEPSNLRGGATGFEAAGQTVAGATLPKMTFPSLGPGFQQSFDKTLTASQASVDALERFVETNHLKLTKALAAYLAAESGNASLFGSSGSGGSSDPSTTAARTPLADGGSLLSLLLDDGVPFTEAVFEGFDNPTTPTPTTGGVANDGLAAGEYGKGEGDAFLGKDVAHGSFAYEAGHQSLADAGLPGSSHAGSSATGGSGTGGAASGSTSSTAAAGGASLSDPGATSGLAKVIASNTKAFNEGTVFGFFHPDAPTPTTGGAYNDGVTLAQYCSGLTAAIEKAPAASGSVAYQLGYYLTKLVKG